MFAEGTQDPEISAVDERVIRQKWQLLLWPLCMKHNNNKGYFKGLFPQENVIYIIISQVKNLNKRFFL